VERRDVRRRTLEQFPVRWRPLEQRRLRLRPTYPGGTHQFGPALGSFARCSFPFGRLCLEGKTCLTVKLVSPAGGFPCGTVALGAGCRCGRISLRAEQACSESLAKAFRGERAADCPHGGVSLPRTCDCW
jgi:hypothetical protein